MANCKNFIDGIQAINFVDPTAETLRNYLIIFAYQELRQQSLLIEDKLSLITKTNPSNVFAKEQLLLQQEKHNNSLVKIHDKMENLNKEYGKTLNWDKEPVIADLEQFVQAVAQNFRDIKHLAHTLSDAPPALKKLQTQFYVAVLSRLGKTEQEIQLKTLSLPNIQDMISQAIRLYDNPETSIPLQNQCQKLVHMGFYEIVRRDCANISVSEANKNGQYQQFLNFLSAKLIDVKQSKIIDNLSDYKGAEGSIEDLLKSVEERLDIEPLNSWTNDEGISVLKARRALFHALRFGQEDRREYAKKIQANLTRDLFWARNIKGIEQFTKSSISDEVYAGIAQKKFLASSTDFERISENKKYSPGEKRLIAVITEVKNLSKTHIPPIPLGKTAVVNKTKGALDNAKKLFDKVLKEKFSKPVLIVDQGFIEVEFSCCLVDAQQLALQILDLGGFGFDSATLVNTLRGMEAHVPNIKGLRLKGHSVSDIERQLDTHKLSSEERRAYKQQLKLITTKIEKISQISALDLDNSEEILLRKLLELSRVQMFSEISNIPDLASALRLLEQGDCVAAVKGEGLDAAITSAYNYLATVGLSSVNEEIIPIIAKAKEIVSSASERLGKSKELEEAFKSGVDIAHKVEAIFLSEYHAMLPTLNIKAEEIRRMEYAIKEMAEDIARIEERTRNGQPALSVTEQDAYLQVLKTIAQAIAPVSMGCVHFKIKHSIMGQSTVDVYDANRQLIQSVIIDTGGVKLPYSLIKPAAGEFIFSYGGSRGVLAPFAGFDKAYSGSGQKARLFTHMRLLGVGQYGSVKEVEGFLSGLNQIIKKGYVPSATPTFHEASRNELRTRPLTARDDPLYRIESDVLQNLSRAEREAHHSISGGTKYWLEQDKLRTAGILFAQTATPQKYQILTDRAKGETFADTANKDLNLYSKADIAYHNPLERHPGPRWLSSLRDTLNLSMEIVREAKRFAALGFAHNDIKPENFLYKKNSDGSYHVKYIDWATGGFERGYQGPQTQIEHIFAELFGPDLSPVVAGNQCSDANGRYVIEKEDGIVYGVNPALQILHGARNGTLPYISPKVLGSQRDAQPVEGSVPKPELNTLLKKDESYMDDWALTTMIFGVCNRHAYFTLVKGRAVTDYIVPGILEVDGKSPLGLKIVDFARFNQFFACGDTVTEGMDVYSQKNALMYIPANQREGEPLHLYRHLEKIKHVLNASLSAELVGPGNEAVQNIALNIIHEIDFVLKRVQTVVATGEGFNKAELTVLLETAQRCIKNYEQLHDESHQQSLAQDEMLQAVFTACRAKDFKVDELLSKIHQLSRMEVLCTYPANPEQKNTAASLLEQVLNEEQLNDKFIGKHALFRGLFIKCISLGQNEILNTLFATIMHRNPDFIAQVEADGLLHYAAEQGMTDVFFNLIDALQRAGASPQDVFALMMKEYGPHKEIKTAPHVKWSTQCFHSAIRNNNKEQLKGILALLPPGREYDTYIEQALHLCARLGNADLFTHIVSHYNQLNSKTSEQITTEKILAMAHPPDEISPYHHFLSDQSTAAVIPLKELGNNVPLAKKFLLAAPTGTDAYPLLITLKNGNYHTLKELFNLGAQIPLSAAEFSQFFKQKDELGKNVLNYILEQGQFHLLTEVIAYTKLKCDAPEKVLLYWLSNPVPANPLRNFLNNTVDAAQQFKILNQLFDAISPDFNSVELQQARLIALLVQEEWLVETAQHQANHEELRDLLHNNKLSTALKQGLFKKLGASAAHGTLASSFYDTLYREVTPSHEIPQITGVTISPLIMHEVGVQRNDLHLIVSAFNAQLDELQRQLDEEKSACFQMSQKLGNTEKELQQAQNLVLGVREQMQKLIEEHADKIEALQKDKSKALQHLQEERLRFEQEFGFLSSELLSAQKERDELLLKLQNHNDELKDNQEQLRLKEAKIIALETEITSLHEKLVVEKDIASALRTEVEEQKVQKEQLLRSQEDVQKQLSDLKLQVKTLKEEADALRLSNTEVSNQFSLFEARIKDLCESQKKLEAQLQQEKSARLVIRAQLKSKNEELAEANKLVEDLTLEIKQLVEKHQDDLEKLHHENDEEVERFSKSRLEYETKLADLTLKLKETNADHERLILSLEAKKDALERSQEQTRIGLEEIKALTTRNALLVQEVGQSKIISSDLSIQLQTQKDLLIKAQQNLKEQLGEMESLVTENQQLVKEAKNLRAANHDLEHEVQSLQQQINEIQRVHTELHKTLSEEKLKQASLRSELSQTKSQLDLAFEQAAQLELQIQDLIQKHAAEVKKLRQDKEESKELLHQERKRYDTLLADLQEQLKEAQRQRELHSSQLQTQTRILEHNQKRIQSLLEQFTPLEEQCRSLKKDLDGSKAEVLNLRGQLRFQTQSLEKAKEESQKYLDDLDELHQEYELVQERNDALEKRNRELLAKTNAYERSLRLKNTDLEQAKNAEEVQKSLVAEKENELETVKTTLKNVQQEKAVLALERDITNSSDEEQLKKIAVAKTKTDLYRTSLKKAEIDSLFDPQAVAQVAQYASQRLLSLQKRKDDSAKTMETRASGENTDTKTEANQSTTTPVEQNKEPLTQAPQVEALIKSISKSKDYELLQQVARANTKADLLTARTNFSRLNLKHLKSMDDENGPVSEVVNAAKSRLIQLETIRGNQKGAILNNQSRWHALRNYHQEKLTNVLLRVAPLREVHNELLALKHTPMVWINPVFQGSAKHYAQELQSHFKDLAQGSDELINYLDRQRCELKELLASLPVENELNRKSYKADVLALRASWHQSLQRIEEELALQLELALLFQGDEEKKKMLAHHGVLEVIKQAQEEQKDIKQKNSVYQISSCDFPEVNKTEYLQQINQNNWHTAGAPVSIEIYEEEDEHPYQTVQRARAGYFREHTVVAEQRVLGRFIEERSAENGKLKLTASSFPAVDLPEARVAYSLAMATQFLASLKEPPSSSNPIKLNGGNKEQLQCLWTALIIIGEQSSMKFGPDAIKVMAPEFDPLQEYVAGSKTHHPDSCYQKLFTPSPQLGSILSELNHLMKDKFGYQREHDNVRRNAGQVVSLFSHKMQKDFEQIHKENRDEGSLVPVF